MQYHYETKGTCSKSIDFEIDAGIVRDISFASGCPGNLEGLSRLAEGRRAEEVVELLAGIKCGKKKTSCPDQLAKALKKVLTAGKKKSIKRNNVFRTNDS